MKTARLKKILTAAAGLPARQARRVLAAVLAKQEAPDSLDEFRAALSEDLKPLGDALWSASQAGDFPAMQAALRKISTNMPDFMGDAQAMADALSGGLLNSYLGKENKDSSYAISSFDRNEHSELPNLPVRPEVKPQPLSHVRIKRRERQTKTSSTK